MTLRMVRHGTAEGNGEGRYLGWSDPPLTEDGRRLVAGITLPPDEYVGVWSSDLRRCIETAAALGVTARRVPALREFDFGRLTGRRWADLDAGTRAAMLDYDGFEAPGGETVARFAARIDAFVASLAPGLHLVVTHGGVIHHLLRAAGRDRHVAPGEWVDLPVSRR